MKFEYAAVATDIVGSVRLVARRPVAPKSRRGLSEPQQSLVAMLQRGATLTHEVQTTGLFRITEGGRARTIHPATVQSLLDGGVLSKDVLGVCRLTAVA